VAVWNRTASKARALEGVGARAVSTPAEAARGAERVHLCLSDDAAVEEVIAAIGALPEGVPIIDHTTVSPRGARERAARLAASGQAFLGCPVFMGPINAKSGSGIMLCAGANATVERWLPALRTMTGQVLAYGEDVGVPAAIKLFGNAMIISITGALTDALTVASESGVAPSEAMQLLSHFDVGNVVKGRGGRILEGDYRASFELAMARKDVRLMIEAAGDKPLSVLPSLAARMDALLAAGHGADDLAIVAKDVVPRKV
jgi:3-hydroxyisobutyrate dehydrogenase-like beta-hydroxyacid dehydrogenase